MPLERKKIASLGQVLLTLHKITNDQLKEVLFLQKQNTPHRPLGELLIELGYATKDDIYKALALQFLYPQLELPRYKLEHDIINLIPKDIAYKFKLIALDKFGNILTVGMLNPLDKEAIDIVEKFTHLKTRIFMVNEEELHRTLELVYK
jgi:type IV pilus assembly protein PilB